MTKAWSQRWYGHAHDRKGRVPVKLIGALVVCTLAGFFFIPSSDDPTSDGPDIDAIPVIVHTVHQGDFEAYVTESGDLESASNVEIKCEVESTGTVGTTIIEIVDEGTLVKAGDFLLQFDDAALKRSLTEQEIVVATDHAATIQAQNALDQAVEALKEYKEGTFLVEKETYDAELLQAESQLRTAQDLLAHTRRMFRKGYVTATVLQAREKSVDMSLKAVDVAKIKLDVLRDFTYDKMIRDLEAEIEKQKAFLTAAEYTEKLSRQRRDEMIEQIEKCRCVAPVDGQVVYANDYKRSERVVIEEGALIREGQIMIRLPDPTQMQVDMRISDSKINLVAVGNEAEIILDVDPNLKIRGVLSHVEPFPYAREWKGGPIQYGAVVKVLDPPSRLRPGQRAKVQITVDRRENVVQTPVQSVIGRNENHYCLIKNDLGDWEVREVEIGPNNDSFVVVESGLIAGDEVALTPDILWDAVTGESVEQGDAAEQPSSANGQTPDPKGKGKPKSPENKQKTGGKGGNKGVAAVGR